jgi:protocatechuate 3,4-dioxygenase beta subunit
LALGPGIPFDGTVLDAQGGPAAHADVVVEAGGAFEGTSDPRPPEHPPYARTATNAKGRFRVRGIPPGAVATVVVRAKGHAEPRVGVRAVEGAVRPSPLEIRLQPGSLVRGSVRDPAGQPFAGAAVFVVPASEPELLADPRQVFVTPDRTRSVRALTAVTDADGTYVIEGLPLDRDLRVAAEGDPHARSAWAGPLTGDAEHRELQADLKLRRHAVLILRVQDAEGAPIAGAHVAFDGPTLAPPPRLAGMGRLEFNGMWPGEHGVRVTRDGYRQVHRTVVLVEGSVHEFEIVLEPGVALAGVVLDEKGRPLPAVRIEAVCREPEPPGERHEVPAASTTTDAEGRFVLGGLRKGRHEIAVSGANMELAEPLVVTAPAADVKVRLRRLAPVPPR